MPTTSSSTLRAAVLATLAAAACTTSGERSDIVPIKVVRPTVSSSTSAGFACEVNAGTTELVYGTFDPTFPGFHGYLMGVVVENRLISNISTSPGRFNTNDFQADQARINYEFPDAALQASIPEHVVPANGLIKAGTAGVVGVTLVPSDVAATIAGKLGASGGTVRFHVRIEGHLLDGSGIKSSWYEYAAVACAPFGVGACGVAPPSCTAPATLHSCGPGQDADVTCL